MEGPNATLRYLKAVVAWHSALDHLCATPLIKQAVMNSLVGLVEVPHGDSSMLAADELIEMYHLKHGLDPGEEHVQHMTDILRKEYTPVFSSTVHARQLLWAFLPMSVTIVRVAYLVNFSGKRYVPSPLCRWYICLS
jgi:hypothetical protein